MDEPTSMWRSICFEDTLQENRTFFVEYEYVVWTKYLDLWHGEVSGAEDFNHVRMKYVGDFVACLREQYPHIRFTPYLRSLASEIVGEEKRPMEIARRIYDYVTKNVQYSYMRNYSLMTCIPEYCAKNLRGDSGVQALLFITLCRIAGVPARWESGLYGSPGLCGSPRLGDVLCGALRLGFTRTHPLEALPTRRAMRTAAASISEMWSLSGWQPTMNSSRNSA